MSLLLAPLLAFTWPGTTPSEQRAVSPPQVQSAVLVEAIAARGEECGLLRPWQAASLRLQTRDQLSRLDAAGRAAADAAIASRRRDMRCDDTVLTTWIGAARGNFDAEYLPELLAAYRAFARQAEPPAVFRTLTAGADRVKALGLIDAKLAALEAAGVRPPGGMTWRALLQRQEQAAAQITAAIVGRGDPGRFDPAQAAQLAEDVARIVTLWLADQRPS
jgi:hypothetical protein